MRTEISDFEAERTVGGTVIISKDSMRIGFSTIGVMKKLKNCTYRQASNLVDDLMDQNPNLSGQEFDSLVKAKFEARGWI